MDFRTKLERLLDSTSLEKVINDKHSSLLRKAVMYGQFFYHTEPWAVSLGYTL
jgi:hypothetical protein